MPKKKICLVAPDDHSFYVLRRPLIRDLLKRNFDVTLVGAPGPYVVDLEALGANFKPISTGRYISYLSDFIYLFRILRLFFFNKYHIIHTFTLKPNLFVPIISRLTANGRTVISFTGLGFLRRVNTSDSIFKLILLKILEKGFFVACCVSDKIWFQNPDDFEYLSSRFKINNTKVSIILGSGVDHNDIIVDRRKARLELLRRVKSKFDSKSIFIVMLARALVKKGVYDYLTVARSFSSDPARSNVKFIFVGDLDVSDTDAIDPRIIMGAPESFQWIDSAHDILTYLAGGDLFVLPSYYPEGLPKSILEAMSAGLPIITTDTPGCRETVEEGVNGFLVPPRSPDALAEKIGYFVDYCDTIKMGESSKLLVERKFSSTVVNKNVFEQLYEIEYET